ncbi:MAG: hypothetical protein ACYS9X_07820 [Planctomycetota bacterium]|jgi:hypothetical protein
MRALLDIYPGDGAMLVAGNAVAQAAVAIAVALIAGWMLAKRNVALRYALYLAALVIVLASPITAAVADRMGFSVLPARASEAAHGPDSDPPPTVGAMARPVSVPTGEARAEASLVSDSPPAQSPWFPRRLL